MGEQNLTRIFEIAAEGLDPDSLNELKAVEKGQDEYRLPDELTQENELEVDSEEQKRHLSLLLNDMSVPERVKLALRGNILARRLLIRDSNKAVGLFVLQNPGVNESELLEILRSHTIGEHVFREIGTNTQWMKSYIMKQVFVANPKAPIDISLRYIKSLLIKDLNRIARSKNLPQIIATQARRLAEKKQQ